MAQDVFAPTLEILEGAFRQLESRIPAPTKKPWKDSFVFRYAERTIHQAIVQKLARTISGLHAITALLNRGLFQEQGMIQRALDELEEDIAFLSLGVISGELSSLHNSRGSHKILVLPKSLKSIRGKGRISRRRL
jgi:hypothetical protein